MLWKFKRQWIWASTVAISIFEWTITLLNKLVKIYSTDTRGSALQKLKLLWIAALWSWENNWGKRRVVLFVFELVSCQFWSSVCLLLFPPLLQYLFIASVLVFFAFHRDVCCNRRLSLRTYWSQRTVYDQLLMHETICANQRTGTYISPFIWRESIFSQVMMVNYT